MLDGASVALNHTFHDRSIAGCIDSIFLTPGHLTASRHFMLVLLT
jgi:hypothetical protein